IKVEDTKVYSFDYGEKKKESFSPLVRVLRYDVDDVVLDNPSMKAIIDFRWKPAKLHFINLFIRFVFHGILYLILCWAYTSGIENSSHFRNILIVVMIFYYGLALKLLLCSWFKFWQYGRFFFNNIYNYFDVFSVISPLLATSIIIVPSFDFSNSFANRNINESQLIY